MKTSPDKREQDRLKTRAAILDATEALMREEGYAAVTSRRIAERAKLKSQLVHYHFGSMDELFQEAFRRSDSRFFSAHLKALTSTADPIAAMWSLSTATEGMDVVSEYVAAANHRKVLQQELVQSWARHRMLHRTMIAQYLGDHATEHGGYTPQVLSFLLSAIGKSLLEESRLGFSEGHGEVLAFVDALIGKLTTAPPEPAKRPRRKAGKPPAQSEAPEL